MNNPIATYRIQFQKEFNFQQFEHIIDYLQQLGVQTIYASPILAAIPGSTHGYDGIDPARINNEIGTREQLVNIKTLLNEKQMQWLQDIVPNHMSLHPQNHWLWDYLEKGPKSAYAGFFDINTESKVYDGRMMLAVLTDEPAAMIANGNIKIDIGPDGIGFCVDEIYYPLNLESYRGILAPVHNTAVNALITSLAETEDKTRFATLTAELKGILKGRENEIKPFIDTLNQDKQAVTNILNTQYYQLCPSRETEHQINYRRFFTVNNLVCLNIQHKEVFDQYHALIADMAKEGLIQGLRIDHVDGLYDPAKYLAELRALVGPDCYITIEKIMEAGELLPTNWDIQGSTGYDFLGLVNNLLTNNNHEGRFTNLYNRLTGDYKPVEEQIREKKNLILSKQMGGELDNLYELYLSLQLSEAPDAQLKEAIAAILTNFPVYRFYGNALPLEQDEATAFSRLLNKVKDLHPALAAAINQIEITLLIKPRENDAEYNGRAIQFYQRLMQFTGPLMAKGVEDTLMYTYNRFIGHNEVGDVPSSFGITNFHQQMQYRQQHWPLAQNATSTHDTKRGEDVRARLNALTDVPDKWEGYVQSWMNEYATEMPDANDRYFIFQTLVGAYPYAENDIEAFTGRLKEYMQKAQREAKRRTTWVEPDTNYEQATNEFIDRLLAKDSTFLISLRLLLNEVADFGIINSLSQVILKCTCPGIPDIYQGTELWDMSFVDPDNRRAVDYDQRAELLAKLEAQKEEPEFTKNLWQERGSGAIKLWMLQQLLQLRKDHTALFTEGRYIPLAVYGTYRDNIFAFARQYKNEWILVAIPLQLATICHLQDVTAFDWKDTYIAIPGEAPDKWLNPITGKKGDAVNNLYVHSIFKELPIAVLSMKHTEHDRGAGVLLSITSLPSPYGVGDFGTAAREFADFLARSNQKYWQVLPVNYTGASTGYSPYSASSAMAGLPLLIDLDQLANEQLLDAAELKTLKQPVTANADYHAAQLIKDKMLQKAFEAFAAARPQNMQKEFEEFCIAEADWLNDFALFMVLKESNEQKAWFQWEEPYKNRDAGALATFAAEHSAAIEKEQWLQYIFSIQWKKLRKYCNNLGISIFGDLPIYISQDSVDVWANRDIFNIDETGAVTGMAGVPPDYFSEDGQLWGMPTFKWDKLKETGYDWWIKRLKKNFQLYDLLRLDHFRAFYDYWDVAAGETTAKNGVWLMGPGSDFFKTVAEKLGNIPFVAEDLGDVSPGVYELRDEYNMPGMRVLQFGFDKDLPISVHALHNYTVNSVAYTGTHDNNTTLGWYQADIDQTIKERLNTYMGYAINEQNVVEALSKMVYGSVARIAILPMQDVLGQDQTYRMNVPSSVAGNWSYRLQPEGITPRIEERLRNWTWFYNRR